MMRILACTFLTLGLFAGAATAADKPVKNQMVKGTVKSADPSTGVLVVNQKLNNETVERQLDIKDTTEFSFTIGTEKKDVTGKAGLELLEGKSGAQVTVKCDKDVNVLKVTVMMKK